MKDLNSNKISRLYLLFPLIVLMATCLYLGFSYGNKSVATLTSNCNSPSVDETGAKDRIYQEGYNDALKFAREKVSVFLPLGKAETRFLSGTVKSVGKENLIVTLPAQQIDFFSDGSVDRTLTLNPSTRLFFSADKSAEQYKSELEAYVEAWDSYKLNRDGAPIDLNDNPPPVKPEPYTSQSISLDGLKVGDLVELVIKSPLETQGPLAADSIRLLSSATSPSANPDPPVAK
jgi:hypothetical protein